jgi:hypothetical protein
MNSYDDSSAFPLFIMNYYVSNIELRPFYDIAVVNYYVLITTPPLIVSSYSA